MALRVKGVDLTAAGAFALGVGLVAVGCGGIVRDEGSPDGGYAATSNNNGGGGHAGTVQGGGGTSGGKAGGTAAGARAGSGGGKAGGGTVLLCGNGRLDPGEICDGSIIMGTCSSATMGAYPNGTLACSTTCQVVTTKCTRNGGSGGVTGTGGGVGRGGSVGVAGNPGTGGFDAYDACLKSSSLNVSDCNQPCGCKVCPEEYAACRQDGGCAWILACAEQNGCVSVANCYQTSCSSIIDLAGGMMSSGARHADPALACLAKSGCGVACAK
jgi:hypothetical protein